MQIVRGKKIETLYDAGQIAKRNEELAAQIAGGPTSDLLVIAVLKGSFIFAADLTRALHAAGLAPEVEFITLSSYGAGTRCAFPRARSTKTRWSRQSPSTCM